MLKLFYKIFLLFLLILSSTLLYQKNTYAYHTLVRIDPIPHTEELIQKSKYVDAYEYLNYFMAFDYVQQNPQAQVLIKHINEKRHSLSYQSEKVLEGLSTGTSDELLGQASAIGSDFFVLGDIRDLSIEATHFLKDEEVDKLLVSLSMIGLVASASTLFTLGSSSVAKSGVSLLKLAQKSKAIPPWLSKHLEKEAKIIEKSKDISSLKPLFTSLENLHTSVGLTQTLKLLPHTNSLIDLNGLSKLSKRYGSKTTTLLKLSDKLLLTYTSKFKKMDTKTIEIASTYGTSGFVQLIKGGEKNFIKTIKRIKAYSKVGYKEEAWKVLLWIMKYISDSLLMLIISIASLLILPWRKILKGTSNNR